MSRAWPEQRQVISLFLVGVKADMSAPGRLTMYSAPGYGDCQTANAVLDRAGHRLRADRHRRLCSGHRARHQRRWDKQGVAWTRRSTSNCPIRKARIGISMTIWLVDRSCLSFTAGIGDHTATGSWPRTQEPGSASSARASTLPGSRSIPSRTTAPWSPSSCCHFLS